MTATTVLLKEISSIFNTIQESDMSMWMEWMEWMECEEWQWLITIIVNNIHVADIKSLIKIVYSTNGARIYDRDHRIEWMSMDAFIIMDELNTRSNICMTFAITYDTKEHVENFSIPDMVDKEVFHEKMMRIVQECNLKGMHNVVCDTLISSRNSIMQYIEN